MVLLVPGTRYGTGTKYQVQEGPPPIRAHNLNESRAFESC